MKLQINKTWIIVLLVLACISIAFAVEQQKQKQLFNLQQDIEALQATLEENQQKIADLAAQNDNLLTENTQLKDEVTELQSRIKKLVSWTSNPPKDKTVYLTFDDGPSHNTEKILNILKEYNIKATFFVNGKDSDNARMLYKRIVEEGHSLGNHTYSHDYKKIYTTENAFMEDLIKLENYLFEVTGVKPELIRFPGGSNNHSSWPYGGKQFMDGLTMRVLAEGYEYCDWNVSGKDAEKVVQDTQVIIDSVINGAIYQKAAIVLLHDNAVKTTTVEALPQIIEQLSMKGYRFATLSSDSYAIHFK